MSIITVVTPLSSALSKIAATSREGAGLEGFAYVIWFFYFILPVALTLLAAGAALGVGFSVSGNRRRGAALGMLPAVLFLLLSPILLVQPEANKAYTNAVTASYKFTHELLHPQVPRQREGIALGKEHLKNNDLPGAAAVFLPLMTEAAERDRALTYLGPAVICIYLQDWLQSRTAPLSDGEAMALNALIDRCAAFTSSRGYVNYLHSRAIIFAPDAPDQTTATSRCGENTPCIDEVKKFYARKSYDLGKQRLDSGDLPGAAEMFLPLMSTDPYNICFSLEYSLEKRITPALNNREVTALNALIERCAAFPDSNAHALPSASEIVDKLHAEAIALAPDTPTLRAAINRCNEHRQCMETLLSYYKRLCEQQPQCNGRVHADEIEALPPGLGSTSGSITREALQRLVRASSSVPEPH